MSQAKIADFQGTDRFQIIRPLGAGGMGVVYEAFDREQESLVALKMLTSLVPRSLLLFKNEFRALQDIQHPNLVALREMLEKDGNWFFTMELIRGTPFDRYVRPNASRQASIDDEQQLIGGTKTSVEAPKSSPSTGTGTGSSEEKPTKPNDPAPRVPTDQMIALAQTEMAPPGTRSPPMFDEKRLRAALTQLAQGLIALHQAGKVHRDVKPSNVLVANDGRVVILDFGLLAEIAQGAIGQEGFVMGTPVFMAPEQARSPAVTAAADWYSFGVVLYHALTGTVPFAGSKDQLVLKQWMDPLKPSLLVEGIPPDLDELCVDLLRRGPANRPTGIEVLRRLGASTPSAAAEVAPEPVPLFVGRDPELKLVEEAFARSQKGQPVVVRVVGESGIGKSALVGQVLENLTRINSQILILKGRCYERESVPYKAVDGVVDALSRYLIGLPGAEAQRLLPFYFQALTRAFPVLADLKVPAEEQGTDDSQELRVRVFAAMKQVLGKLAKQRPLVIFIDDLQWADADSVALLSECLRPPDAPSVLLLIAERPPHDTRQSVSLPAADSTQIDLEPLPRDAASALVAQLLGKPGDTHAPEVAAILKEGRGHPLFIDELVRLRRQAVPSATATRLDDALWARVVGMEARARDLVGLAAVSGVPLQQSVAAEAMAAQPNEFSTCLTQLRSARLIRTTGVGAKATLEPYHDRVREAVLANLPGEARQGWHQHIANALETLGFPDPEALLFHWLGANDRTRASRYAPLAAAKATLALAFDRAVQLYRTALELHPEAGPERQTLLLQLAEALVNAGRGAEAAEVFEQAVVHAKPAEAHEFKRRAAEQLLRSGRIDQGLVLFQKVLASAGVPYVKSPGAALLSVLVHVAQIHLRGFDFKRKSAEQLDPRLVQKADACWAATDTLTMVDPVRGCDFATMFLLYSLKLGDPRRVSMGIAMEAVRSSFEGKAARPRALKLNELALSLAREVSDPLPLAHANVTSAAADFQVGEWKLCLEHCDRAEQLLRNRCRGVAWELSTVHVFALAALFYLGELKELGKRLPGLIAEADGRNDWFASVNLRVGYNTCGWLGAGEVDTARTEATKAMSRWSVSGYHAQHLYDLISQTSVDLYSSDPQAAQKRILEQWPTLSKSLLFRVQVLRSKALHMRASAALGVAAQSQGSAREPLLNEAAGLAKKMEREGLPWSTGMAQLVNAGVCVTRGQNEAAVGILKTAATVFDGAGMALYAAAARARCAKLVAGDEGRAMAAAASGFMTAQQIQSPEQLLAMIAPGF